MKSSNGERQSFKISAITAGCLLALAAQGAQAQQAQAQQLDTVVVTGIRKGIEDAISVKKTKDNIVESISAEDIGKLPDHSIGESIARLPGLSAQRIGGRAQVISVRGLSPDFATTLLNGRELVSTGDNRSVEFDQYPSELLSGVVVYKTPDAALVGQGLSGTLDMQTVRPLNFKGRSVALNARLQRNALGAAANADADGNRFSVSYIDQTADRKLGFAIGYAHLETPVQENQVGIYEPWEIREDRVTVGLPANTMTTAGLKALRRTGYSERDGVMATLEYRPSREWTSVVDLFHTKAKQEDTANQLEIHIGGYNGSYPCTPNCAFTNVSVANNTLQSFSLSNVYPLVRGMYNRREDKISAFGWNNKVQVGDATVTADLSYSKANRDELSLENNTQRVPAPSLDNVTIQFRNNDFSRIALGGDYSNPANLFLRGTIYGSGYGKVPQVEDELTGFRLNGELPTPGLGLISELEFGLSYVDRSKVKKQPEGNINVGAQGDTAIGSEYQYGLVNLGFAGLGQIPSWNVPGAVARYMVFNPSSTDAAYKIAKSWAVDEATTTLYLRGNIDGNLGGLDVRGNAGVQLQRTKQSSDAIRLTNGGNPQPVTDSKTVTDFLPSLNLAFGLGNDQTLRLGLARQVARPRVDQLRSAIEFGVADNPNAQGVRTVGGDGGNTQLDPWRANAFDLSYEKYFGTKAYVAAAYFYKDLKSYIYKQINPNYDFSKFVVGVPQIPGSTIATTGNYSAPANGEGGRLSGFELSASMPLELVTPALKGFGVVASASFNSSGIEIKDPESGSSVGNGNIELPGLSKRVYNLTAYYENAGFELRVSQRKRSDFIGEIGNFNGNRTLRYVVGEDILDAQIGYNFGEGMFKGLGLLLQVNNLNDASYRTYFAGQKDKPLEFIKWGRSYMLGMTYKF
ncbi:TonB-dependent receptor [Inhella inkyongensis]|uniref:TonB-dependent receptor n=1 Tax=Inhella inkyongensis TaxID=392593 RepID=A0A840SCW2_9BURK|nr:TonB-dependent receptor [Inhella inkyongensis]MBB5206180.1 TonB-dependent receptor [Inhella inkyongensis]